MFFNKLFNRKKNNTVDLRDYAAAYAGTPGIILDSTNLLVVLVREDGIVASREVVGNQQSADYGLFKNAEEIIEHFGITDPAICERVHAVVAAGDQI